MLPATAAAAAQTPGAHSDASSAAARLTRGYLSLQLVSEEVADLGTADLAVLCPREVIHDCDDDPDPVNSP